MAEVRRPLTLPELARASELLDEWLDVAPEEREAWLAGLEPHEPQLARVLRAASAGQDSEQELLGRRDRILQKLASADRAVPAFGDASEERERLAVGQSLSGRYRIECELGEGGMGVVYLASDEQVAGERFAVKVLKGDSSAETLSLLREEVHKTRRLSHPNIVDVHSVNVDGSKLYVLMEHLEGTSLAALLDDEYGRGMPFSRAWPIIEDVGAALGYAHDHNVIHSDLKPANIFVTTAGRTKLLDFGIARVARGTRLQKTPSHLALTPAYASCEMLEGKKADRRDDIYALGCVIYEMLCGDRPFGELTALEARESGAQVQPIEMLSRRQNSALRQALALERETRTASVEKLLEGLAPSAFKLQPRLIAPLAAAILLAGVAIGLIIWAADRLWLSGHSAAAPSVAQGGPEASSRAPIAAVFNPPPHSIAVLPFVNMSGDPRQEYFSEGLAEELLNALAQIPELQVAARTSSFSFSGQHPDIATVAHKLNVGAVLEGSVRRSQQTVRVTAQLIDGVTGFHLWSQTYDRHPGDVLKLQTDVATAVARTLKVTLLADTEARIAVGGTRNPAAFDAYLRAARMQQRSRGAADAEAAIAGYTQAVRLDPDYALAFAMRSIMRFEYAANYELTPAAIRDSLERARADARQAIALAPDLAEGHLALASLEEDSLHLARAEAEYERAVALAPGDARALRWYGSFVAELGRTDEGIRAIRHAATLDPLNPWPRNHLGTVMYLARRYPDALAAYQDAQSLDPGNRHIGSVIPLVYYQLGDLQKAYDISVERSNSDSERLSSLALIEHRRGRTAEAEATLAQLQSLQGDAGAYGYAEIYAQWGNTSKALEWLKRALKLHARGAVAAEDGGLDLLLTDPLMDPLRREPRFQAVERSLGFAPTP